MELKDGSDGNFYEEMVKFEPPLHIWETKDGTIRGKLCARIIRKRDKWYLDIREHLESLQRRGYTSRGLRLSSHDVRKLIKLFPSALEQLEKGESECATTSATGASEKGQSTS